MDGGFKMVECMKGGLWLTAMGRIVLDDHGYETFSEPEDTKLFTSEEMTWGIPSENFYNRLTKYMIPEALSDK